MFTWLIQTGACTFRIIHNKFGSKYTRTNYTNKKRIAIKYEKQLTRIGECGPEKYTYELADLDFELPTFKKFIEFLRKRM